MIQFRWSKSAEGAKSNSTGCSPVCEGAEKWALKVRHPIPLFM